MKAHLAWLAILVLVLSPLPILAQYDMYDNGPINGTTDAWTINFGYVVSDSFMVSAGCCGVNGFMFGVWEEPGDILSSVQWSITSAPLGVVPPNARSSYAVYGAGTASGSNLTDKFISSNQYGYDIDLITVTGLNVPATPGTKYWLSLFNAAVPSGDPVYWDENSGKGCGGAGCPSQAYESVVGSIPSEAFTVTCTGCACGFDHSGCTLGPGSVPEPHSLVLFGSGILGLAGLLRRKLHL